MPLEKYFNNDNPVEITNRLAKEGKIVVRPVRGGVMLYLPEDVSSTRDTAEEALRKMGLSD